MSRAGAIAGCQPGAAGLARVYGSGSERGSRSLSAERAEGASEG